MSLAPYRGPWNPPGDGRPREIALPPAPMPRRNGLRLRKQWRYVGCYGPELMACFGTVAIGPAHQAFWAVWDRDARVLHERTGSRSGLVAMSPGLVTVEDGDTRLRVEFSEQAGIEVVTPYPPAYAWTAKQAPVAMRISGTVAGRTVDAEMAGAVDDSAGYPPRHVSWRWSAGVGESQGGEAVAWNLVTGIHDDAAASERSVWVGGVAREVGPVAFAADLSSVGFAEGGALAFTAEATRKARENRIVVRSDYEQPFGTFAGELPGGIALASGFGVMERHEVAW